MHTKGGLQPPQETCYLRGVCGGVPRIERSEPKVREVHIQGGAYGGGVWRAKEAHEGGVWHANGAHRGGFGANEARGRGGGGGWCGPGARGGGGGVALTRRTGWGGGGVGANEAHRGWGGLALTRREPSPICAWYNEAVSAKHSSDSHHFIEPKSKCKGCKHDPFAQRVEGWRMK